MLPEPCGCITRSSCFMRKEHAEHIGIEGRRIALRGLFGHRTGLPLSAGIVDGDVEAAEPA